MAPGARNSFTTKEDEHLVEYIAKNKPQPQGRTGNNLYIDLEANAGNQYPWARSHPWQSWRERYRKNQEQFDLKIKNYQKMHLFSKTRRIVQSDEEEEEEEELEETAKAKAASSSKTKLPSGNQHQAEGSSSKGAKKRRAEASTGDSLESKRIGPANLIPKPSPKKVFEEHDEQNRPEDGDQDAQNLSDDLMHDLFGSFVEEDEGEESRTPSPAQILKSPQKIYPDVSDLSAPRMFDKEPRIPGAFEVQPPLNAREPAQPKSVAVAKPSRPIPKKRKRKEEDPFQTPPDTPVPLPSKSIVPRQPPTIVQGSFRTVLKNAHDSRAANDNNASELPPKRRKKNHDHDNDNVEMAQPLPRRPTHVNAIASSSKTQLPPSHVIHRGEGSATNLPPKKDMVAPTIPRSQAGPPSKPLGIDVLTRPSIIGKKVAEKRTVGSIPTNHHDQAPEIIEKPSQDAQTTRTVPHRPSSDDNKPPTKAVSRTGSHNLPTKPTSDNDPFTANHVSEKAAGKAREDASVIANNPPRRIDFYQEKISKRLRAKASLPSRRSSVVSSHTSTTTSSTAKKATRGSGSFRQSITELDMPDEEKREFALAAAEDIASIMEQMAKDHGVSFEIAMKTYMRTRSLEKTKLILRKFLQTLIVEEQKLYAEMPHLNHVSDEEDADEPEGSARDQTPETHTVLRQLTSPPRRSKNNRRSLTIKPPVEVEDPLSDYSPPNASRAGQFARLVKQNRKEEAIEREKRRVSGRPFQLTQLESPDKHVQPLNLREITVTPTPQRNGPTPMEVDKTAYEDDDMYVDDERGQDADDESDSCDAQASVSAKSPSPSVSIATQTVEDIVSATYDGDPELALEHQVLALNINDDNADIMRKFEARHDPDFLRVMSYRLVGELLAANAQDSDREVDEDQ